MVGHHQVGLEAHLGAEPVALGAGAGRGIEGEQARLDLVDGEAGDGTGEAGGEGDALVRLVLVAQDLPLRACRERAGVRRSFLLRRRRLPPPLTPTLSPR